jgi:signal transduction histidine kinase
MLAMVLDRHVAEERREKALGRLTHELKVPIVTIRGAAEFMMRTPGVNNFFDYDYPGDIWSWTELMGRLIDNAEAVRYASEGMQIKKSQTRLLANVIAPAIKQVNLLLRERTFSRSNIEYSKESFSAFPLLWVDRNGFQQVIFNLLSNAIKYAYDDPEAFRVEIEGDESEFVILFRDWGPGIKLGTEERIFEEGFRCEDAVERNVAGQGLGLWIVRQIVERHGGTIEVTNLMWPTEFRISLPQSLASRPSL